MNLAKKLLLIVGFSTVLFSCSEQEPAGPYKQVANPAPTTKPEVLEFFAYFCPHCYELDKKVEVWKKRLPKSVTFKRVPLTLGTAGGRIYSRVFYISETLGVLDQSHQAMFQLFHVQKRPINSELQLKNFFLSLGITEADFEKALKDPGIDEKVAAAEELAKTYRIIRVPGFVINGTYFTDVATAGGEKQMFTEIGRLIRKKK
jgi:thiol:disulfide interchange protein DsbA